MNELLQLEKTAIERLKAFEPTDGYYLAYSGGKDSDAVKILAQLSGVKFEAVHNLTTVDAPETVRYVKSQGDVRIDYPKLTMWQLIVKKLMPPTRINRYCCAELKEKDKNKQIKITGVRWAESWRRKENADLVKILGKPKTTQKSADEIGVRYSVTRQGGLVMNNDNAESRRMVEHCYRTNTIMVNPIIEWSDKNVWEFLKHYGCESNPLYQCGFTRIGCIGCPMAGKYRYTEFRLYPKYYRNYIMAFERMLEARREKGIDDWKNGESGEDVMKWWLGEDVNQMRLFEE